MSVEESQAANSDPLSVNRFEAEPSGAPLVGRIGADCAALSRLSTHD